jgi:hypothetical protein
MPDNKPKIVNLRGVAQGLPTTPDVPTPNSAFGGEPNNNMSFDDIWRAGLSAPKELGVAQIPLSSIYKGNRYKETLPGTDYEEMAAQQQSGLSKLGNATAKFAGVAGTSFVSGTVGLVAGIGTAVRDQRWAGLIDNDVTRGMDDIMKNLEDKLPNYYTHQEQDASWYSPDNILTVNFWSDKVLKNLGYSVGALAGGVAWGSVLRGIGLTSKLVQAGKGLQAATAIEEAMSVAPKLGKYAAFENTLNSLAQQYVKSPVSSVLKNSDRILTSAMGTFGEASMEGLQGMNKFRNNAIQEYKSVYGVDPTGEELNYINQQADKLGMHIWGANSLLLTATNYIQLPKILGSSRKADKALINKIEQETLGGGFVQNVPKTAFGRITKGVGSTMKSLATGKATVLFAPSEAFEEGMQSAIQTGVTNYFERAYKNRNSSKKILTDINGSWGNILTEGIAETLTSKEGLESILIGGLSGGIQQAGFIGTYKDEQGKTKVGFGKSGLIAEQGLFGSGGERQANTEAALTALNKSNIDKALKDQVKFMGIGIGSQKLRQQAIANNDLLSEKDYERDFALSYVMPRAKYGKIESVNEELDYYKNQAMDADGFRQLATSGIVNENESREDFIQRIDNLQSVAKNVDNLYSKLNDKYGDKIVDGQRVYSDDVIDRLVYAASKIKDYDSRIPGINGSLLENNIITQDIIKDVLEDDSVDVDSYKAALSTIANMDVDNDTKQDLIQDLNDLAEISVRRKAFINEYNDILAKPENYKDELIEDTPDDEPEQLLLTEGRGVNPDGSPIEGGEEGTVPSISITTKSGIRNIKLNKEYFLGRIVEYDAKGKEVYRAPMITVIGENEDGTIKIRTSNGKIRDISKEEFEDYNLVEVEKAQSNKKLNYYMKHWNTVFEHYGRKNKDGSPAKGRLEYNDKDRTLTLVYTRDGKVKREEITGDQVDDALAKKKGYKHPLIKAVGELTAEQVKAEEEFNEDAKTDSRVTEKRQERLKILSELFDDLSKRQDSTKSLIEQKQKSFEAISEELSELQKEIEQNAQVDNRSKKAIRFKKVTKKALDNAMKLSRMQTQLEEEVQKLQSDLQEIEYNMEYVADVASNIDEYSTNFYEFKDELENELLDLEILQEKTAKQISFISKLIDEVQRAIDSAISMLSGLIQDFENRYPNVPRLMGQDWVDFLKDNPNFLKLKPNYREELQNLEDIVSVMEDGDIAPNEKRIEDLKEHIDIMVGQLKDLNSEITAKGLILDKFEQVAQKYKQQKAQEDFLKNNQRLTQQLFATMTTDVQNFFGTKPYEPVSKKNEYDVVGGSRPAADDNIPHQARANYFGNKFHTFTNKNQLKAMIVTADTEDQIIPGLTDDFLKDIAEGTRKDIARKEIIYMVMVQDNGNGTHSIVGQDGKPLAEGANKINNAIYQVFPAETLTGEYDGKKQSMFREGTPENIVTSFTQQYKQWRQGQLSQKVLGEPQAFTPSFGSPKLITYKDQAGNDVVDKTSRTSAQAAGLVTNSTLRKEPVIEVAVTNDTIKEGSVAFNTPKGRVFLKIPGVGMAKLFNKKFNDKEAKTIYDVMLQVSKNILEDGELKTRSNELFEWLKSTIYWGIAHYPDGKRKPFGYNNVWFEAVDEGGKSVTKLFITGLTKDSKQMFNFTPSELENPSTRAEIIGLLKQLYNNTNNSKLKGDSFNNPYFEITGIDKQGNPIYQKWPNYQTYLLSDKAPNENGELTIDRGREIPLATQYRPVTESNPVNRTGIYFTLDSTVDDYIKPTAPVVMQQPVQQPVQKAAPVAQQAQPAQPVASPVPAPTQPTVQPSPTTYNLKDEGAENVRVFARGAGPVKFKANLQGIVDFLKTVPNYLELLKDNVQLPANVIQSLKAQKLIDITDPSNEDAIFSIKGDLLNSAIDRGLPASETTDAVLFPKAVGIVIQTIFKDIVPQITNKLVPVQPAIQDSVPAAPVQAAPVSDLNAKYDEELTDLQGAQEVEDDSEDFNSPSTGRSDETFRLKLVQEAEEFQQEDWSKVEKDFAKMLPNVPFYRVKNMIQATNGRQAWGMLHNGAVYVYENAEVGTAYHEVFEAVWKMFAGPAEKQLIIDEFRNREGSYQDRFTGELIEYKNATNQQIKEELAEQFRDAVLQDKLGKPVASKGLIGRLFSELIEFIKSFFTGKNAQNNTQELFNKIGDGYFAKYNPYESKLSYAKVGVIDIDDIAADETSEFRLEKIPSAQTHDIIQHMTYSTLSNIVENKGNVFNVQKENKQELYTRLRKEVLNLLKFKKELLEQSIAKGDLDVATATRDINNLGTLFEDIKSEWGDIVEKHQEHLKTFSIEFDENDEVNLNDEDASGKSDWQDARKIDSFRKANSVIKLLLATLPKMEYNNNYANPIPQRSSIGGIILMPADQVYATIVDALHSSVNIDDMFERLRVLAKGNSNYAKLYTRITNSPLGEAINFSNLEDYNLQLMSAFWKAVKKQNADVVTVFVLPSGEVVVSDSTLTTAAKQAAREMMGSISERIRGDKSPYIAYNRTTLKYNPTPMLTNRRLNPSDMSSYVTFLNNVGINFKVADLESKTKLTPDKRKMFTEAVEGLRDSLIDVKDISSITSKTLDIDGRLFELGLVKASLEDTSFETTYFNINGERTQSYVGVSAISTLHDVLSKLNNINDLNDVGRGYSSFKYLLTDVFTKDSSVMLQRMFDIGQDGDGGRKKNTEEFMKPVFIDGTIDQETGKKKESSKLTFKQRLVQEINLNLDGIYLNLVPGDASIEHAIKMHNSISPFVTEASFSSGDYLDIFKNYFISEVLLSRDGRPVVGNKNSQDLRFFKAILGNTLHDKIMKGSLKKTPQEMYENNKNEINAAVKQFIEKEAKETEGLLKNFGVVTSTKEEGLTAKGLSLNQKGLTQDILSKKLKMLSVNYMIANIEMHKLLYSDPYQYSDELKRIKNFNSPRQALVFGSTRINVAFNEKYNRDYDSEDIGYTDMTKDFFKSTVISDVFSTNDLPGYDEPYEETDGGGYISLKAYRVFALRSGEWNSSKEKQFRYDIAYEKFAKGIELSNEEKKFEIKKITDKDGNVRIVGKNPNIASIYTPIKPIVSGSKADGKNYNDVVLDKFALVPFSYRILHELNPDSNAMKFYEKMASEKVDYAVYKSGRKVGAGITTPLYNAKGEFNTAPFAEINNIPFYIMGVQSEVPSKDTPSVTQGSQITKLVTMDFMEAGVPIDFDANNKDFNGRFAKWESITDENERMKVSEVYRMIKNNQDLLQRKTEEGFNSLLKKLDIKKTKEGFVISDPKKLVDVLKDEILKREVNDNITAALNGFEKGNVVLEATPAYQQIRNILYSIADKNVVRPKISGGLKVQIPSTLFEGTRKAAKKIINAEGKETSAYESDFLKFYSKSKDGKKINVCEIMLPRWFESSMSDKELLKYLNETEEGQKILSGLGYRIPTQKQNSIDSFVIKGFLPADFKDSVVIPSALVKKVGSDFDIDKLSIYLKNVITDENGEIRLIESKGTKEQTIEYYSNLFDKLIDSEQQYVLRQLAKLSKEDELDVDAEQRLMDRQEKITKKELNKQDFLDGIYKKVLENEYIQSLQDLVEHPSNFDSLIKPNSAKELKDLTKDINKELGISEVDYSSVGNMLNRKFMSSLRQSFVSGKYAIGIAAVGQTNHAQNQRSAMYIDVDKLNQVDSVDREILGGNSESNIYAKDPNVNFKQYNSILVDGKLRPTLSMIKNKAGETISDIIGMFIDGYVDISKGAWIMELGATPNVASTWLFLAKVGVPIKTVAYFMNQPIIKDYLRTVENKGYSWLFIDSIISEMLDVYQPNDKSLQTSDVSGIPSEDDLFKMIKYNQAGTKTTMDDAQKLQQQYILKEFIKYAKMSSQLFDVTQGSNFDTATINDPYLVFKKRLQLDKARKSIISSVDKLLDNSFVGPLKDLIYDFRDAFAEILISDKPRVRTVMEDVLAPYVNLSDRQFVKVSQKAVNDLFDWAMQTDTRVNINVADILLGSDTKESAAQQIINLRDSILGNESKGMTGNPSHPLYNNIILNSIKMETGDKSGKVNNLYIAGRDNKVYDQNLIIYGFSELKKYLGNEGKDLYGKLVRLAVLQSGLTNSPIAFTNLLPYEDFKGVYNNTLSNLENMPNLADFQKLHVFERNNWNNSDIAPFMKAKMKMGEDFYSGFATFYDPNTSFLNKNLKNAVRDGKLPKLVAISAFSSEGRSEFVSYSWTDDIPYAEQLKRAKAGDRSHIKKVLLQKVYTVDDQGKRIPLMQIDEKTDKQGRPIVYKKYIYKAINAWGDSFRAQEFYNEIRPSVLDNDFEKVERITDAQGKQIASGEVSDEEIASVFGNQPIAQPVIEEQEESWEEEDNNDTCNPF